MAETPGVRTRRNWLWTALEAGVAVTVAAICYPVVRFLWPRKTTSSGELQVVAPFRLHELRLDAQGRWPPPFDVGGKPCLVIQTPDGEVRAFNALCTHVDCTVEYRPEQGDIFCNCHNGVYDLKGNNVSGPPPRPLETYVVTLRTLESGEKEIVISRPS